MSSDFIVFQGGTLVIYGEKAAKQDSLPPPFRLIKERFRCEGYRYCHIQPILESRGIRDQVPRWEPLDLTLSDPREPHAYQLEALEAWGSQSCRGSVVLPTGAGKTFLAIQAIDRIRCSTAIVCPTIDILHQWYRRVSHSFHTEIGVYYGAEKRVLPITITTYHSAGDLFAEYGNTFRCIILDEVHHAPAPSWGEAIIMAPAPIRLGLTATYPTEEEQMQPGRWRVDDLVGGPLVYCKQIEDLLGEQLARYRTQRIRVALTKDERQAYETDYAMYMHVVRERQLIRRYGADWFKELMRLSAMDCQARQALLARQRIARLLASCQGKMEILETLLQEHVADQVLIFTESNTLVYKLSQQYLIPAITHETSADERKDILDNFQARKYRAIVTSKVLNEGVDVPEAKVAIVLGGTAGAREYIQRLGRVLRKVENKEALLYEVLVRGTTEESKVQRRHARREVEVSC
jgi:superfamily II DNA or RNA helicase